MRPQSPVIMRKVDHEAGMRRQYTVTVTCDLWGTPLVVCQWGRIGTTGQTREYVCTTAADADALAARLVEAKERRGYGIGPSAVVTRAARARKPAAKLRRECTGKQLWLFDPDAPPVTPKKSAGKTLMAETLHQVLPADLADLASVTARRRAPIPEADRQRRINMAIGLIRAYGMPIQRGCAHGSVARK